MIYLLVTEICFIAQFHFLINAVGMFISSSLVWLDKPHRSSELQGVSFDRIPSLVQKEKISARPSLIAIYSTCCGFLL